MKALEDTLGNNFSPFEVFFKGYGMKNYFFQAFYVAVELNEELQSTRSKICEFLNTENDEFMPHLSLYYGKQEEPKKRALLPELPEIEGSFMAETFYLVSFDPKNIEWKILNSINLGERKHD
jgi:2'-5' RNA ligase